MQTTGLEQFRNDARGFTLVEFLVAMAITGLVAMAAYSVFSTSNWSYMVQEDVSEAQQTVRVAADLISKDIRAAGFGLPDPPFSLSIGGTTFTSAVSFTNSNSDSDSITILGIGRRVGVLSATAGCNAQGNPCIGLNSVTSFTDSGGAFMAERRYVSLDGVTFLELDDTQTAGDLGNNILQLDAAGQTPTLDRGYAVGITPVFVIQAVTYTVQTDADGPYLQVNDLTEFRGTNQKVARNVEDIQFAYSTDQDGTFEDVPSDPGAIIAVRANIVARTAHEDPKGNKVFKRPGFEDRPDGTTDDGYRRRALTKVVKIRNLKRSL